MANEQTPQDAYTAAEQLSTSVPGGRYIQNGKIVDANGTILGNAVDNGLVDPVVVAPAATPDQLPFDPSALTVDEIGTSLQAVTDPAVVRALMAAEADGKNRMSAATAFEQRLGQLGEA